MKNNISIFLNFDLCPKYHPCLPDKFTDAFPSKVFSVPQTLPRNLNSKCLLCPYSLPHILSKNIHSIPYRFYPSNSPYLFPYDNLPFTSQNITYKAPRFCIKVFIFSSADNSDFIPKMFILSPKIREKREATPTCSTANSPQDGSTNGESHCACATLFVPSHP